MNKKDYGIICDVGGKGKGNQDSVLFNNFNLIIAPGSPESKSFCHECILSIVCDGVSASNHGEKGSSYVIRALSSKIMNFLLQENFKPNLISQMIESAISEANNDLMDAYKEFIDAGKVPKTTLVGLLIIGQYLWIFNLGDSRAFLIKDDLIGQVSKDHIGTGALHEITQAMGQVPISPEIKFYNWAYENDHSARKLAYNKDYYALICSDGLTDKVSQMEIKEILLNDSLNTMQEKVNQLYDMTIGRNIDDNVSIIGINLASYFSTLSVSEIMKLSYPEK